MSTAIAPTATEPRPAPTATPEIVGPRRSRDARARRILDIRPATYREMPIAADIIRSTASWYRPFLDEGDMSEHEVGREWIEENYGRREFFLGRFGRQPVGVLSIQETGDFLYLGYVYLYEQQVGHGYGRQLLEFAQAKATERGKQGMVLIAHPEAEWATRAYERFGFDRIAEDREEVLAWEDGWLEPYYEEGFQLYALRV